MAVDYRFSVPAPGAGEEAAVGIRFFQSDTFDGAKTQEGADTLLLGLSTDPVSGLLILVIASADPTKYSWGQFYTASGTGGDHAPLSPEAAAADETLLIIDLEAIGLPPSPDVEFIVKLTLVPTKVGNAIIDPTPKSGETDDNGHLEFLLHRGPTYEVTSSALKIPIEVATDGLSTIDLADLIV